MATVSHAPHIRNTQAGNNYYDPMHSSIFEVCFSLPEAISSQFANDIVVLSEQVTNVSGLDALQKTVQAGNQKFLGADMSYLNPVHDNTYADLTIEFNLNLRNVTDAYVLNIFKAWSKLGYDLQTGSRRLMKDYIAPYLLIKEANRDGTIWRESNFARIMLTGVTGLDTLDYSNNEARKLTCTFRTDMWDENMANTNGQ